MAVTQSDVLAAFTVNFPEPELDYLKYSLLPPKDVECHVTNSAAFNLLVTPSIPSLFDVYLKSTGQQVKESFQLMANKTDTLLLRTNTARLEQLPIQVTNLTLQFKLVGFSDTLGAAPSLPTIPPSSTPPVENPTTPAGSGITPSGGPEQV